MFIPGTDYPDIIFVAPLYDYGRVYVLIATEYEGDVLICDEKEYFTDEECPDGGLIWVDGFGGYDTISLLWSDSTAAGSGHIADGDARRDFIDTVEACRNAGWTILDYESSMVKGEWLYGYCEAADVDGGDGNDIVRGTSASGPDTETLRGGSGSDGIFGNGGDDVLLGGPDNDWIVCGAGTCYARGEGGDDRLAGGSGVDHLYGDTESDFIAGWGNDDYLDGGSGNDFLFGHEGADTLAGVGGNDTLAGGLGTDTMNGGSSSDIFYCRDSASADPDFDPPDADTDCSDRPAFPGDLGIEATVMADPYAAWVRRYERTIFFGPGRNGKRYDVMFHTTSSTAVMQAEVASGARILYENGVPLHSRRIQSDHTCGPQSLEMVLRYLGYTEEQAAPSQLLFPRDPAAYPGDVGRWEAIPYGTWSPRHAEVGPPRSQAARMSSTYPSATAIRSSTSCSTPSPTSGGSTPSTSRKRAPATTCLRARTS